MFHNTEIVLPLRFRSIRTLDQVQELGQSRPQNWCPGCTGSHFSTLYGMDFSHFCCNQSTVNEMCHFSWSYWETEV